MNINRNAELFREFVAMTEMAEVFTYAYDEQEETHQFLYDFNEETLTIDEELPLYGNIMFDEEFVSVNQLLFLGPLTSAERFELLEYCNEFNESMPLKLTLTESSQRMDGTHLRLILSDVFDDEIQNNVAEGVLGMFFLVQEIFQELILADFFGNDEEIDNSDLH